MTPARRPIRLVAPTETLTVEDQADRLRLSARSVAVRLIELLDLVWRREPTLFIELGVAWAVGVWSATLLVFGLDVYPPPVAGTIGSIPVLVLIVSGLGITGAMLGAIAARMYALRGYASFGAAMWLGFLSFAILAGNFRLAAGWVYLGTAAAALLPFWRVVFDRRI